MIDFTNTIKPFMVKISSDLSIDFVRADQEGQRPSFPFLSYKILNSPIEPFYSEIRRRIEIGGDPDNIKNEIHLKGESNISFNFFSNDHIEALEKSIQGVQWFHKQSSKDYLDDNEIVFKLLSTQIENRTEWIDNFFEYRYGFDATLIQDVQIDDIVEIIKTVEITNNNNGDLIEVDLTSTP